MMGNGKFLCFSFDIQFVVIYLERIKFLSLRHFEVCSFMKCFLYSISEMSKELELIKIVYVALRASAPCSCV